MGDALGQTLALALGVALSPLPIVAVILMLLTPKARVNGSAFVGGWLAGIVVVGGIVLAVGSGTSDSPTSTSSGLVKLLLFTTNLLAILVAGGGLLTIMGYGRAALGSVKSHERRRAALVIGAATLIVIVPLSATGIRVGRDSSLEYTVNREVDQAIEGTQIELAKVTSTHGSVEVVLADQKDASFAEELAAELHGSHPEATVRIQLVQTKLPEIPAE